MQNFANSSFDLFDLYAYVLLNFCCFEKKVF